MPVWVKKCFVTSPQKWGEAEGMDGICKGTMFVQPWISKPAPPDLNCSFNPLDLILKRFFGWICTKFHPFVPLVGKSEWQTVQLLPIAFIKVQSEFAPNDNSSFAFAFFSPKSSSGTDQNLQSWAPSGLMQMEIEMVIFNVILKSSSRSRSELANLSIHSFITCLLIKIVKQTLQIM